MNDLLFLTAQLADAIHLLDCMANEVDKKRGIAILEEIHTRFLSELQSGWISVADRLPEHDESFDGLLGSSKKFYVYAEFVTHWRVMKFHRSRNPDTGEYAWTENVMYKDSKLILSENSVSHWQPEIFPQPPKETKS